MHRAAIVYRLSDEREGWIERRQAHTSPVRIAHLGLALAAVGAILLAATNSMAQDRSGVGPTVITLPKGPGTVSGLAGTSRENLNAGTFGHEIGIEVPPNAAGFIPEIALRYDSGSGCSPFGLGWSCEPYLVIERRTSKGFPTYTNGPFGDTFLLNGSELVPLSDGSFRAKTEGAFRRCRPVASVPGGAIDSWLVEAPDGRKHSLGRGRPGQTTGSSRIAFPGLGTTPFDDTFAWYEDAAQDLNGNRIVFVYRSSPSSPGTLVLERIRYHAHGNQANAHEVSFVYEARPDALVDNRAGFARRSVWRCREIRVSSYSGRNAHLHAAYALSYDWRDAVFGTIEASLSPAQRPVRLGISYLTAVTRYDGTRGPGGELINYLPPVRFWYSPCFMGSTPAALFSALEPLAFRGLSPLGRLVSSGPERQQALQMPSDAGPPSPSLDASLRDGRVQFADLNGDALPDLVDTRENAVARFKVAWNTGRGVFASSDIAFVSENPFGLDLASESEDDAAAFADLDCDGAIDLVHVTDTGSGRVTRLYPNLHRAVDPSSAVGFSSSPSEEAITPTSFSLNGPAARTGDVNGDGRMDLSLIHI